MIPFTRVNAILQFCQEKLVQTLCCYTHRKQSFETTWLSPADVCTDMEDVRMENDSYHMKLISDVSPVN